jgi:hypothetical protein
MVTAGKWVASIVGGGIGLGLVLGAAMNPRIKDPEPQWWLLSGRDAIVASNEDQYLVNPGPSDLNPYSGYRPDLDYSAEDWALPLPAADFAYTAYSPPPATLVDVPAEPSAEAELAADDVAAAAEDASEAAETEVVVLDAPKSALVANGIY